ncbi:unnamed protein product [Arabidopsis lyrata]|uniref:S-protein homolog n=1 Tax=Arabidopsis lyrata subsp. lyrata TaxID=81972 RepID=D7MIH9_ARALL|nr:hypothetical protein ARALYDRAFT_330311 [Arabidopsis lyrata subsp. lyrata]CAH8277309.1 unnamed protein product [Arabidopsis lyrata]
MRSMNRLSTIFFVFAVGLTMTSNTALSDTSAVWIRNLLHEKNDLIVHCKSTRRDMGYHRLHPTGSYNLLNDFDDSDEFFWCHLWQGPNFKHHQVFKVDYGNVWEAREDGIYLSNIQNFRNLGQSVFVYGWDVPLSRASSLGSSYISLSLAVSSLKLIFFIMDFGNLIFSCVGIFI